MKSNLKYASAIVLSALFALICAIMFVCMIHPGDGFVYPLDDSYIHLALAKNLASTGVWGLSPDRYAFCSSSPSWTAVLASLFAVFGYCELLPLILSLLSCIGAIWAVDSFFRRHDCSDWMRIVAGCVWMVVCQLPVLGLLGMEHSLHVLLIVALIDSADRWCNGGARKYEKYLLPIFAALAVATRYESMFLVVPLAVLLACARRWKMAVAVLMCAVMPIGVYGLYSLLHGGTVLPNTLMVKGNSFSLDRVVIESLMPYLKVDSRSYPYFVVMLLTVAVALRKATPKILTAALVGIFVAEVGHLTFVSPTLFRRYEGYVLAAAAMVIIPAFAGVTFRGVEIVRRFAFAAVMLAFAFPLVATCVVNCSRIVQGSSDVRCQQVQMARIFSSLPPEFRGTVALNDIGVMALRGGLPILDLAGLADREVADLWQHREQYLDGVLALMQKRDVKYMAVFNGWFPEGTVSRGMLRVGCLVNPDNLICSEPMVMFYAEDKEHAVALRAAMEVVSQDLPGKVEIR